jgi:uncharacterized protein YjbJ (UPF0337 family)
MHEYDRNAVAARVPVPKPGIGQRCQRLLCGYWDGERPVNCGIIASGRGGATAGKAKQGIGNVVGSDKLKAEGAAQELKGDAQKATGDAKAAVKDAANQTAKAINKNL